MLEARIEQEDKKRREMPDPKKLKVKKLLPKI